MRNASRILGSRVSASSYTFLCRRGSTIVTRAASEGNQVDNMATPQEMSSNKVFGGFNRRYKHESSSVGCPMTFTIFFPPAADSSKVPVGCTHSSNFEFAKGLETMCFTFLCGILFRSLYSFLLLFEDCCNNSTLLCDRFCTGYQG